MAKYNLMENRRYDYFDRYFDEDQEKKDKSKDKDNLNLEETSVESDNLVDENLFTSKQEEQSSGLNENAPDLVVNAPPVEAHPPFVEKSYPSSQESQSQRYDAYDMPADETLAYEKITRKGRFFKLFILFVGLATLIYLVFRFFPQIKQFIPLSKETSNVAEISTTEKELKTETVLKTEKEIKQDNYLKTINNNNNMRFDYINRLISLRPENIHYSSIFLYDNILNLEIFGLQRDDIAKFNMQLKNNKAIGDYQIQATDFRPGHNGGFFSLLNFKINQLSPTAASIQDINYFQSPESWLNNIKAKYNILLTSQREVFSKNESLFRVSRREFILQGKQDSFFALIGNLAKTNSNLNMYKLVLIPVNQRNITSAAYQLNLILDFYLK